MNPWIRRLAMMLGIVVPGFLMIVLQVHPLILVIVLTLIAFAILFAVGSLTIADLKGLRRSAPGQPAKEPAKTRGAEEAGTKAQPVDRKPRLHGISRAARNLASVVGERWRAMRAGKPRMEAIDRALDRTVPAPAARPAPAIPKAPVPAGAGAVPRGPGGDPFHDLLNATFEPALLDEAVPGAKEPETGMPGEGGAVPGPRAAVEPESDLLKRIVPQKAGSGPGPEEKPATEAEPPVPEGPKKETTTVIQQTVKVESLTSLPKSGAATVPPTPPSLPAEIPAKSLPESPESIGGKNIPGGLLAKGTPPLTEVNVPPPAAGTGTGGSGPAPDQEMLSFASEGGGTMDDLLATLKSDAVRVKRSDDSSLLRDLKGVRVQGKELEEDLSALLKELQ
ncbi:MAG: hypothetical protein LUQ64_02145 [Methanomicrobiales archaeon]|nr:hypothetical protein [Methanomicrobiales archaeon]